MVAPPREVLLLLVARVVPRADLDPAGRLVLLAPRARGWLRLHEQVLHADAGVLAERFLQAFAKHGLLPVWSSPVGGVFLVGVATGRA